MVVHNGRVIAEWGDVTRPCNLYSVRKSLLNALIGIAVERGQIDPSATMEDLGIDDVEPLTPEEKQASVADLLKSRSGIYLEAAYETERMQERRPERGAHAPGTHFYYNNWDFNTLGTIYEKAARMSVFEGVHRELGRPIGMQDFQPGDGRYVRISESRYPAYVMDMSARDLARFGLLYARGGVWNGERIISKEWIQESTRPYSNARGGGYGYMWWTAASATDRQPPTHLPEDAFWGSGNWGQYVLVVPSLDLVLVHRVDARQSDRRVNWTQFRGLAELILAATPAP